MKKIIFSLVFLLFIGIAAAEVNETIVAYWSFDNLTDDGNLSDDYNHDYDGYYFGTAAFIETNESKCINGPCLDLGPGWSGFPGPDDLVRFPTMTLSGNFSFSFWAKIRGVAAGSSDSGRAIPFGERQVQPYNAYFYNNSGTLSMGLRIATNFTFTPTPDQSFNFNKWDHWVFSYNGSNVQYYKNGELIKVMKNNAEPGFFRWDCFGDCNNGDYDFNGLLDEFIVYNRSISGTEIETLYSNGTPESPLAGPGEEEPPFIPPVTGYVPVYPQGPETIAVSFTGTFFQKIFKFLFLGFLLLMIYLITKFIQKIRGVR